MFSVGNTEKEEAQTFRQIFDQSSELIYIHDEHGTFIDVNQTVLDIYGYSREEVIGKTPEFLAAPGLNDLDYVAGEIEKAWNGQATEPFEWWSMRKDGSFFLKEIKLKKVKYFGRDVIICTGRDITGRERDKQELLNMTRQLKSVNKELDSFMWKVSHDLKSPLSSIKGIINVAKIEKDPESIKDYLDHIDSSIDKLNSFIRDMEDITRNKQLEVNYAPVDFETLLDSVMEDFQFNSISEGVSVKRKVKQKGEFATDSTILKSILHNLVSNSYKYKTEHNPQISISISSGKEKGIIEVKDNGIGISKEYLPKVFEMFFRATEKSGGSGLGLFIVKEGLEKIGGSIDVKSREGQGTKFTLTIPNNLEQTQN